MSRFRYVILPRLLLALSTLALLTALFLLWLSLGRPLPSISLACRQACQANCFTGGELLASGTVWMNEAEPSADAWAVLRFGEKYARVELDRTAGLLWTESGFDIIIPDNPELFPFSAAASQYFQEKDDSTLPFSPEHGIEVVPLAVCTDDSVVRLEGELLWLGGWEDPQEALGARSVSINWSPAGSGVWAGEPVASKIPVRPNGGSSGVLSIWLRGYDADGNLVCSYDPTA